MTRYDAWKLASPPEPVCDGCGRELEDGPATGDYCHPCRRDLDIRPYYPDGRISAAALETLPPDIARAAIGVTMLQAGAQFSDLTELHAEAAGDDIDDVIYAATRWITVED